MDNEETIGSTTDVLVAAINDSRALYWAMYSPGSVSTHDAYVHQQKFITGNQLDIIYCHPQSDLPLAQVKEKLKDLGATRLNSLGPERMVFFETYKKEVLGYSRRQSYVQKELNEAGEKWVKQTGTEVQLAEFMEKLIQPLRALLLLILAVNTPADRQNPDDLDVLLNGPTRGGQSEADLMFRTRIYESSTTLPFEFKNPEENDNQSRYVPSTSDFANRIPVFSDRREHSERYSFSPGNVLRPVPTPSSQRRRSKSTTHQPSPGLPTPSPGLLNKTLYKIAIQCMSYALSSILGVCVLTNVMFDHVLFRYAKSEMGHHFQLHSLSHNRPLGEDDKEDFFHFFLYILDQYAMPKSTFNPLPPVSTTTGGSAPLPPSMPATGRQKPLVPSWASLNINLFSPLIDRVKTTIMPIFLTHLLHKLQPVFTMESVSGRIVLKYAFSCFMLSFASICIPLTFKLRSRQAAILEHVDGIFVVKVHGDNEAYAAEVKALDMLSGVAGVPELLGTGSTVAGNKFLLMSKVGDALTEEVTDDEAQQVWDTVLKEVHGRSLHHHDLVYHNIARDKNGKFYVIDFGESSDACSESVYCQDRDWLAEHNVVY